MDNNRIHLDGIWQLYYAPQPELPTTYESLIASDLKPIPAAVPGNVELALFENGLAEDPFWGDNVYSFRKYEFYGWWYCCTFSADEAFVNAGAELCFGGVDTFSQVFLNGQCIGETSDMMMEYQFDTKGVLQVGENVLAVRIDSSILRAREFDYPVGVRGPGYEHIEEMIGVRKPGHCFGWDIAPRFVSAGIWRGVTLRKKKTTYLKEVYVATQDCSEQSATLTVKCRFATDDLYLEGFAFRVQGQCGDSTFVHEMPVKFVSDEMTFSFPEPKLWWPKGYGEANLYDTKVELLHHGEVADVWPLKIGVRKITIDADFAPGDAGQFLVQVNGTPILCKGSNWVPLDAFHSRDAQRVQKALSLFAEAGCNILRCWGGNVYEDHAFYDICDAEGILVWQDFSLACAIYPQSEDYARIIEAEAIQIVKKLRNHTCLLLWAGGNEVDAMYACFGYDFPHVRNNRLTRETLPRVLADHDPFRFFLPSSPYIPTELQGKNRDLCVPEQHNWGPRDYFKGDFYKHSTAHFISEIGYHGCPAVSSLKKFISPACLWPIQNAQRDAHNTEYTLYVRDRGYDRNQLMVDQVKALFGIECQSLEQLAMLSQISQAEAKKFFIEMVRLKKWRRTGVIWWNMLDCWPQISDAVVDYYFHKKLAFYYIRRSQQPICLICGEAENWKHTIWLCNDSRKTSGVRYRVWDGETGEVLSAGTVCSPANENVPIASFQSFAGMQRLICMKWETEEGSGVNHYVCGYPPLPWQKCREWTSIIAGLDDSFTAEDCWK